MKFCRIIIAFATLCGPFFSAQSGERIYSFLNLPASARQAALGGETLMLDDPGLSAINPAVMVLEMDGKIAADYAFYLAGTGMGQVSYTKDLEYGHLISVFARYMDYGNIPRTDESGEVSGDFKPLDATAGFAYAYQFDPYFNIGGNIALITSKIDTYNSSAVAATAAMSYIDDESGNYIALTARNFGYQLKTYNGTRERLPFRVDLSYSKKLENFPATLHVTAHNLQQLNISEEVSNNGQPVNWSRKVADHFAFGAELFPDKAFNFRLGYHLRRGNELSVFEQRSFSGLTFGFGLRVSYFRFDFAHARYSNASNVNQIGIVLDLFNQ